VSSSFACKRLPTGKGKSGKGGIIESKGSSGQGGDASAVLNLAQRFERLPPTWYQHKIFLIIAIAWLFDSINLASLTFVLAPISNEFGLSNTQAGLLASSSFAGMFFGGSIAGELADLFGRKVIFQTSMIIWGLTGLLLAMSWSWESLIVFRFLLGLGMGAQFPIALSLVSELVPSIKRGQYIGWLEGFWPLGFISAGVLALVFVPLAGWRSLFVLQGVLAVWVLMIRRVVPESPRWYESRGLYDEADELMRQIEDNVEERYGRSLSEPEPRRFAQRVFTGFPFSQLFTAQYRRRSIMIWLLWFFVLSGYYGITTWISKLLADVGFSIAQSIEFTVLMTLWGIPGFLSASYLVERLGRKVTVAGYVILSAVAAFFYGQATSLTELIIAGSFMQFFFFGMWSSLYAYTPEVFPTRARATGSGTASAVGRLGALLGPALVPVVLTNYGNGAAFAMAAASFVIGALVVLIPGPETKQRVLEEVSP
jgi:MFS transporter, putative metabolite:H+ symporter